MCAEGKTGGTGRNCERRGRDRQGDQRRKSGRAMCGETVEGPRSFWSCRRDVARGPARTRAELNRDIAARWPNARGCAGPGKTWHATTARSTATIENLRNDNGARCVATWPTLHETGKVGPSCGATRQPSLRWRRARAGLRTAGILLGGRAGPGTRDRREAGRPTTSQSRYPTTDGVTPRQQRRAPARCPASPRTSADRGGWGATGRSLQPR